MARAKARKGQRTSGAETREKIQTYHLAPLLFIKVDGGYEVRLQGYPNFRVPRLRFVPRTTQIEEDFGGLILSHIESTLDPKTHKPPKVFSCPKVIDIAADHAGFEAPVDAEAIETLTQLLADSNAEVRFVAASGLAITWPEVTGPSSSVEELRHQAASALHLASKSEPVEENRRAMLATLDLVLDGRFLDAVN